MREKRFALLLTTSAIGCGSNSPRIKSWGTATHAINSNHAEGRVLRRGQQSSGHRSPINTSAFAPPSPAYFDALGRFFKAGIRIQY
jgi:hypothetical protein